MRSIKNISIPTPCHENWNNMIPVEQGRHCKQCSKTVTDFTAMTNAEIINYFGRQDNVCGRFETRQLAGLKNCLPVQETPLYFWKRVAIAAAVTSLFAAANVTAQSTLGKVKASQLANHPQATLIADTVTYTTIRGQILADDDNKPLPSVAVVVKGTTISTQTDAKGEFSLYVPSNAKSVSISYIGFQSVETSINDFKKGSGCVSLKMTPMLMGEVVIVKKAPFYKRWWYKVKRIF